MRTKGAKLMGESSWVFKTLWEDVGKLGNIRIKTRKAERVIVREFKGEKYLASVGSFWDKESMKTYHSIILESKAADPNFVLSLINLVREDENLPLRESLSIPDDAAATWVEKNGFPKVDIFDLDSDSFYRLPFEYFYTHTGALYLLFKLWLALLDNDEIRIYRFLKYFSEQFDIQVREENLYLILQHYINIGMSNLKMQLDFEEGKPVIHLETDNLFSAAYFQLAQLMTKPKDYESWKHLKTCPIEEGGCGNIFWGHGNRKYCPDCRRSTAAYRRKKRKERASSEKG